MCWSQTSSGILALIGALMSADQFRRCIQLRMQNKPSLRMLSQAFLYLTYTLMELLQHVQYRYGLQEMNFNSEDGTNNKCVQSVLESSNVALSVVAHILVWIQPIVHNFWCLQNTKSGKLAFRMSLFMSCLTFVVASVSLYLGYNRMLGFNPSSTEPANIYGIDIHNVHHQLCSYQGTNHLFWMFS